MLYIILAILAALILLFIVVVATRPAEFRISRSTTIAAPPVVVFDHVNNLRNWKAWSPWEKLDPDMKKSYEGPEAGAGAKTAWSGNKKVGEGRMTITESKPLQVIQIKLEFIKPFTATNQTEFTFQPQGKETVVTWTMTGRNGFMMKMFGLLMNMDKMIGNDFEKGLAAMKAVVEQAK